MAATEEKAAPALDVGAGQETVPHARRRTLGGYLFMPLLLAAVLAALYLWVGTQELDSIARRRVNLDSITTAVTEHLVFTAVSTVLVLLIAVPLGVLLTRPTLGRVTQPAVAVFNIGQALPTIGILALFAIVWDIGFWPVVIALVSYTVLPVLRNTMVGLQQVDHAVIEAARGMGMTRRAVLVRIELPLAVPIIMAGVRTALVINVGTATLAAFVNGGALGGIIVSGITSGRELITIVGAVLTAVLALLVDYVAGIAEDTLRPRGLQ